MRKSAKMGALCVAPILFFAAVSVVSFGQGLRETARRSDAILVFGARVRADGSASPILRARTRHAFELWQRKMAPKIVCTGGIGEFAPAESAVSRELLMKWGVPESAILIEENSTSTRENALETAKILPRGARVIAVSQAFHLWRGARELEAAGFLVTQSPEPHGWAALHTNQKALYLSREIVAICRDYWRLTRSKTRQSA